MIKKYTCIVCPNGCEIEAEVEGTKILAIKGACCQRGETYVKQEWIDPQRNIATSALVENGNLPLVSVRLTHAIPKAKIMAVMNEIKKVHLMAPVKMGQTVIKNVAGLHSDVISTKNVYVK
jgi:CxxC motif-containing protein